MVNRLTDLEIQMARDGHTFRTGRWLATVDALTDALEETIHAYRASVYDAEDEPQS